jgi:hypothetical protein
VTLRDRTALGSAFFSAPCINTPIRKWLGPYLMLCEKSGPEENAASSGAG